MKPGKTKTWPVRFVAGVVAVLSMIGVFIVVKRTLFLIPVLQNGYHPVPTTGNKIYVPEVGFGRHPLLTLIHVLPGLLFIVLAPLQFIKRIRYRLPRVHRIVGRIVVVSGLVVGISALIMSFKMSIGGVNETAATTLFAIVFLFSLIKAFVYIRRHRITLHREWMIRAFAIGFAVATTRPIVGIFFATSRITGLTVQDFFGAAFWISFTLHLIAAEIWINYTRPDIT
jgi:uncharacterized membrane protein